MLIFLLAFFVVMVWFIAKAGIQRERESKGGLNAHGVWKRHLDPPGPYGNCYYVDPDEDEHGRPYDRNGRVRK